MSESEDRIAQLRALGQNGNLQRVGAIDPDEHAKAMRVAAMRGLSTSAAAAVLRGATAGQLRQIDGEDFGPERPLSSRSPSLQAWLAKPDNKAIAQGDADAMSRIDDALQKLRPERGLVGDFEAALGEGFSGLEGSYYHLAAATGRLSPEEAAAGAAAAKRSIRASQAGASQTVQQYRQRLEESKGFGVIPAALSSPTGLAGMVLESLAFSAPPLALGGVGAVVGSAGGPIGTGVGLVAGSFVGGVATETGAWIDQQLEAAGVDTADEVALARAYRTPDLMARIQAEAIRKGIGTAGIDALSTLIGMRGVSAAARAGGKLAKAGRLAGEAAVQSGLESAGEAVGQLAAVGTVDPKEVALEGVASLGQTGGEMVLGRGARFLAGRTVAGARSVSDTEAVREAAAAWPESKLVKRLPAKAREFVAAQLVGQDQELTAARFDREAWDAHWQAAGKDPAAELVRVLPATGRAAYLESEQTGTLTLPLGNFLDAYSSSTDLDELTELARWRPDGPNLREQSTAGQEALSDLEAEVARTTTLYQREADIASQIARIDEQLKTLPVEGLPGEAGNRQAVGSLTSEDEVARQSAIEIERSALKEMLVVLSGQEIDPETRKIAEQEVAERKARLAELAIPAAKGAGEAKPAKATGRPALTAERVALKAELDGLVSIRQAEEGGEVIRQKVRERLITAGRSALEAEAGASLHAASINAFSSRYGVPAAELASRVSIGKSQGGEKLSQVERGEASFTEPDDSGLRQFNIELLAAADESTFLHESSHVWMQMLADIAAKSESPQAARDDIAAIREFLGVPEGAPFTEDNHEQWARSFEAFVREGKAPSAKLRAAFAAFRTFLVRIYRSLLDLERQAPGAIKLSDDIRAVMGRMLATDEEIAEAGYELGGESLPAEALSKMTDAERGDYLRAARAAKDEATAQADRSASETAAEQRKALRGAEMDVLRVEAALAVDASPSGQAYTRLREKGRPRLDRASVEALYGKAGETQRLDDMGLIQDRGGVAIDEAASSFGFDSGDALGKALLAMENREGMIERVARARLAAEHPELRGREAGRAAAKRSVANEERVALLEREQRILQRLAATAALGEKAEKAARGVETGIRRQAMGSVPTVKAVRATAERMLAAMPLRAIRPNEYLSAARRESTASADRVRVGAFQKAAEAKGRERLNHELYRQALKIQKTADKDRKRAMFIAGDGAQKTLTKAGESYVDQANGILDRFEFRRISAPEAERRATLTEWAAERETEGRSMEVPKWVLNEARRLDHQSLTPSQLHDVREVLDGIYHLARTKGELLTGKRQRDRAVESATIAEQVRSTRPPRKIITDAENAMERAGELGESFLAAGTKASTWTRMMDGNEDGGPATVGFVRRINDATDNKAIMQRGAMEAYGGLYEKHFDKDTRRALNQRRDFAGVGLSHEARLSILSLMGAPEGRQRLKNILTADQLQAVLESYTEADAAFVKDRWALFDGYFKLAVAQQQKIAGQTPVAVEHVPFTVTTTDGKTVQMEGGYHPLQYKDKRLFSKQGKEWAADAMAGRAPAAMFEVGFLKSRVEEFTGRLRLDRGVSVGHLLDITHALTMREAVIDVQALLSSSNVHDAIQETYGKAALHGLRDWLVQIAADSGSPRGGLEKVLGYLRHGAVSATLGMRVTSAFKQLYGIKSAIVRMGPGGAKWMTLAAGRMMGDPATAFAAETWIDAKSKFMAERPRGTYQRELNEKLQSVTGKARSTLTYLNFYMLSRGQRVADRISFIAQYEKTMSEKPDAASMEAWDKEAVARAEQFVKDSQSGGQLVDLSEWESGNAITRLLTTYATEMSLKFNLTRLSLNRTRWKEAGSFARFIGDMTLLYFTEAAIAGLAIALSGDDDDEALEKAARKAGGALADTMPILRELSGPIQGFRYQGSAGLMQVPALVAAAEQLMQGEMDAAMWKSLNTVGGSLFAYPAKAINDFGDAIDQVMEGDLPTALVGIRPER